MAGVNGATAAAINKVAAQAHASVPQYITPQQRLLNSIRNDVNKNLATTMKATDQAHRENNKDIDANARSGNKAGLKSELQDQKDLERERRNSISEHETNEEFLDRIQRRLNKEDGEFHRALEENKAKALRGQQTFDQFKFNQVKIINNEIIDLNGIAEDAREVQAEDQNDQIVSRNQIESIRKRRGSLPSGNFGGGLFLPTGRNDGRETIADVGLSLSLKGNKLTGTLANVGTHLNSYIVPVYGEVDQQFKGNGSARATQIQIDGTMDPTVAQKVKGAITLARTEVTFQGKTYSPALQGTYQFEGTYDGTTLKADLFLNGQPTGGRIEFTKN